MASEDFYKGNLYGLDPESSTIYTGASLPSGAIGASTGIQTANQLKDVTDYLNQGMKKIEVSMIKQEVFDMIPKQHLEEINRLSKLTGAETSFHAPIVEPSGFTEQGWSEGNREMVERQLKDTIIRAHRMSPEKSMPVTIHSSAIPGTERVPVNSVKDLTDEERSQYKDGVPIKMLAINTETGDTKPLTRDVSYYPERGKVISTPEKDLDMLNRKYLTDKITSLAFLK